MLRINSLISTFLLVSFTNFYKTLSKSFRRLFLNVIASPSTYPCQWVSEWVSGSMIVSDLGDSYCIYQAWELVLVSLPPFFIVPKRGCGWGVVKYPRVSQSVQEYLRVSKSICWGVSESMHESPRVTNYNWDYQSPCETIEEYRRPFETISEYRRSFKRFGDHLR